MDRSNVLGAQMGISGGALMDGKEAYMSRTIGQNINARIDSLRAEISRLEGVREQLESGTSLLDVRIEDLRQAMNY